MEAFGSLLTRIASGMVCWRVLQGVAVCCRVLRRVAACCSAIFVPMDNNGGI